MSSGEHHETGDEHDVRIIVTDGDKEIQEISLG